MTHDPSQDPPKPVSPADLARLNSQRAERLLNAVHASHANLAETLGNKPTTVAPAAIEAPDARPEPEPPSLATPVAPVPATAAPDHGAVPAATASTMPPPADDHGMKPAEACLLPVLLAAGWAGSERDVRDALPHFDQMSDMEDLRIVLARLHFQTVHRKMKLEEISRMDLPCLVTDDGINIHVVTDLLDNGRLGIFNGETGEEDSIVASNRLVDCYSVVRHNEILDKITIAKRGWVAYLLGQFKPLLWNVVGISFLINLSMLVIPLFVMHVYDLGIGTRSESTVIALAIGAGLVIATDLALRTVRTRAMAYFGARFDALLSLAAFQQLLHLPVQMTESAPIGAQITRLKQFEGMRDLFTGTLATTIVDIPFVIIFMIAIAAISGQMVLIPFGLVVIYVVMALVSIPMTRLHIARAGEARQRSQNVVLELLSKRNSLADLSMQDVYIDRYAKASESYSVANFRAQQFNGMVQTISQALVNISGVATLAVGAIMVLDHSLSQGALIAIMALVWRVLSPLQQTFLSLPRLEQSIESVKQFNRLMTAKLDRDPYQTHSADRDYKGALSVSRVQFRYPTKAEPTLRGINFSVKPGELVAITGPSGSGKSTLLKVMSGLYPPQGGAVLADGLDIRQINPTKWRSSIGYVTDEPIFFYGTVAQNLRFGCPEASDEALHEAWREAGIDHYAALLPEGLNTRMTSSFLRDIPPALKQRFMLARAYARSAPIYLLDYPANDLDEAGDEALQHKLKALRGTTTTIFTTQRPSHMKLADRLLYMEDGVVLLDGPPEAVLNRLAQAKAA